MAKVLIVEDDQSLRDVLRYNLGREGYEVVMANDGAQALEAVQREKPDLILLDILLPELDGYEVCRILRRQTDIPIIMLTAKDQEMDKVMGLELGADDYITKPFSLKELLARIRAQLRRHEDKMVTSPLKIGNMEIDTARHKVSIGGRPVELSPKEFELLTFLLQNKGIVFSRNQLLEKIWGYNYEGDSRSIDVHIRWLRKKIEFNPQKPRHLITVRGFGYKFEE